jgi:1-acyl-sn-glycerol-3-phosphate acyltransferase
VSAGDTSIDARVRQVVRRVTGGNPEAVRQLDSLAVAELVLALEEEFAVRLPEDRPPDSLEAAVRAVGRAPGPSDGHSALGPGIGHLQWFSEVALWGILRRYFRLRIAGAERVPRTGPVVLASNHDSLLDIPFLGLASPRRVWFMAKEELFRGRFGAWFFHALGGFPVDRIGPDVRAVRAALEVLHRGGALGMFPEGTRSRDFLPFLPGAAWAALAVGAPLVPVAIRGTADAMPRGSAVPRRTHVRVSFGEPIEPGREDEPRARLTRARDITRELRVAVADLD